LVAGLLEEVDFPPDGFEAVTLWDVLEHVGRPSDTLRRVQRWLADGGYLFLNLPDVSSWTARLMGRHWVLLLREHLWYFSPATMAAMLRRTGFELIEARPNTVHFSPANIAGRLAQQPGPIGRLGRRLSGRAGLKRMSVKFRMGEMQVVGRKLDASHNRSI
jgi:2-polyprenyl-3-methyl-5-hydroxy-6-metoxy-1,4-benzoquinol methylase